MLGSGELLARIIAFAVTAVLTRRIGAAAFGELAFASAITGYALLVPHLALGDLASRAVARDPDRAGQLAASATRVRLVVAVVGMLVVILVAWVAPISPTVAALMVVGSLGALPQALNVTWAYKALERTFRISLGLALAQVVTLLLVLVLVNGPGDLLRVPVAQVLGEVALTIFLLPMMVIGWRASSFQEGLTVLRGASAVVVWRMFRALIVTADMVMLGFLAEASELGYYSAAYRVCFLLTAIAASAHVVFQPALMRAGSDALRASVVLSDALWMAAAIGLPLVVGGGIVGPDLLALLFGDAYRAGGDAFRLLLVAMGFLFVHGALSGSFLARNELGLQVRLVGVAAALNIGLNAVFIPTHGIVGASVATVAAEGLTLLGCLVMLRRWGYRLRIRHLVGPLIGVVGMATALVAMPQAWHVLTRIGVAAAVYIGLMLLTRGSHPNMRMNADNALTG